MELRLVKPRIRVLVANYLIITILELKKFKPQIRELAANCFNRTIVGLIG